MAILQLIAEKEKSLCFDFLEEKIRTVKDKDGKVLLDENGNAIVKTATGTARIIRNSLPNASYIGFTGTPISWEDRSTIEVFGDYIDVYDMTQAVLDGATRPVYYESRVIKLKLDDKVLGQIDAEYSVLAKNADEEVIQELLKLAKEMFRASEEGNKLGQKCV